MRKYSLFVILLSVFLTGCSKNISVNMTQIQSDGNSAYSLTWGKAFPINYFKYIPQTNLFLKADNMDMTEMKIHSVKIENVESGISQFFYPDQNMVLTSTPACIELKLNDCFSEMLQKESDLEKFNKIDKVTVLIEITSMNEKKNLSFEFKPVVVKSNRILDNLMSI